MNVDDIFEICVPDYLEEIEDDYFSMVGPEENSHLTIRNYEFSGNALKMSEEDLKRNVLPTYKKYVDEVGCEAVNDLVSNDKYISQSFKLGDETYYYLTTWSTVRDKLVVSQILLRHFDDYSENVRSMFIWMCESKRLL